MNSIEMIINNMTSTVIIPLATIIVSTLLVIVTGYVKKVSSSIIGKNELENLKSETQIKNDIIAEISSIVEAVVSSSMTIVDNIKKENDGILPEEDKERIKNMTKQNIYNLLPSTLMDSESQLVKMMGGKEIIESIIDNLIEKYVIQLKSK